jgi:Domain of unknown function (DUF5665)
MGCENLEKHYKDGKEYLNGKLDNVEMRNMKDIDTKFKYENEKTKGESEYLQHLHVVESKLDNLIFMIDHSRIRDYMALLESPRRLLVLNAIAGLARGLGQAIGLTVLAAMVMYWLSTWMDMPIIGKHIAEIMDIVDKYRSR